MSYEAGDFQFNFHYNIAIVKFESMTPYPTASLKSLDHSGPVIPKGQQYCDSKPSEPYPHCPTSVNDSNLFTICPGDKVIALGRHQSSHNLMAAPGEFSFDCCDFDCGELLRASCLISINGIGGPLINCNGEVIGINFIHNLYTAFLPINIAYKCVEHLNNRRKHLPWIGIKVKGLNVLRADTLEAIFLQFPDVSEGVIVEEVVPESPAKSFGIYKNDVIIACCGKRVGSSSEFFGILLDNVGGSIDVSVARRDEKECLLIRITVGDTSSDKGNRWPVPIHRRIT